MIRIVGGPVDRGAVATSRHVACRSRRNAAAQAGFTLVEIMVALTLGLIILAGMVTLFANTSVARGEVDKASRQIENGRYALQVIGDEIRHAGYYGALVVAPAVPASAPDPCSTAVADVSTGMGLPIQGYAPASSAAAPSCLQSASAGYRDGTAILAVRRASAASAPAFAAGEFNIQVSGCAGDAVRYVVDTAASGPWILHSNGSPGCKPLTSAPIAAVAPLYVRLFYVSNCSGTDCSSGADSVPTLKRMDVKPGGISITPIVDGIENLQFDYGLDTDGDGAPNSYSSTSTPPSTVADWGNVMAARVHILARNTDATGGYTDSKTYTLGNVAVTPGGNFKRHAYSELVRLNNPSGRRE
jgi:type IV pilus assembly protein PilW